MSKLRRVGAVGLLAGMLSILPSGSVRGEEPLPAGAQQAVSEPGGPPAIRPPTEPGTNEQRPCESSSLIMDPESEEELKPTVKLRGRIHADAIFVNQSEKNKFIIGDVENATGFRRARLGAQGTVGEQVNWVAEFDFAGGNVSFKDVFVGVNDLPIVRRVRVGHLSEPFSLEGATNTNYFPFAERSPIMSLDPARNWGVGVFSYTEDERVTLALAAFRSGTSNASGNDITDEDVMAYDARLTCLPWYDAATDGRRLMHLGAAFSQRFPMNDVVNINQGPQSNLLSTSSDNPGSPFLPTITVPASQYQLYNVEWAIVLGPFSVQAEWSGTRIDQIGGGPVFLHGFYVFASYFLTGENRQYLQKDGSFGMTRVRSPFLCTSHCGHGPGGWELTARFAYVDFSNANIPPTSDGLKVGDRDAELTLGVNWYLNDYTRLMFNYVHVVPVDPNFGPSYAEAFFIRTAIFW